jgi:hypothetical protein
MEDERAEYAGYVRANKFVAILKRQAQQIANSRHRLSVHRSGRRFAIVLKTFVNTVICISRRVSRLCAAETRSVAENS